MTIRGVDISSVQGNVNPAWLQLQGFGFVIAKSYTGNDGADPFFQMNVQNCKNVSMPVAAYNFLYPLQTDPNHPNRDPVGQAQLHYKHTGDITVAADLEWSAPQDWERWEVSATFINDWALSYLQEYERISGRRPLLYTYPFFAQSVQFTSDYAAYQLWLANYSNSPVPKPWDWQP